MKRASMKTMTTTTMYAVRSAVTRAGASQAGRTLRGLATTATLVPPRPAEPDPKGASTVAQAPAPPASADSPPSAAPAPPASADVVGQYSTDPKKRFGRLTLKADPKQHNVWFDGKRMLGSGSRS